MKDVDVFLEPVRTFLVQIAAFLPRLGVAILIVAAGWVIAKAVRFAVVRALRAFNFGVVTRRAGIDDFLEHGGVDAGAPELLGWLAKWTVIIAALAIAFNGLGLVYVTELAGRLLAFLPRVALAVLLLVFGLYAARVCSAALTEFFRQVRIQDADLLGRVVHHVIVVFVVLIGIDVLDVGGSIVRLTFLILLAGLVLALALAFGLGGQRWAGALLERWWPDTPKD
ncbi:MAG: hypothetical protein HY749_03030 [Gammaproteobacteria bacterium]|nr:hypothetical protein [Gammaproteobacteria bacterium]